MKKLFFLLTAFTLVLSCSSDETSTPVSPPTPIVKYTITLSAGEGGTVSTTGGEYELGQTVSVTATPQGEYLFKDWSDGNTNATRTITISSNTTLTANFEKKKYPLTLNIEGEGEVLEEIVNSGRTTDYDSGTTVKLTAVPAEGWEFVGWTGAIESTELEVQLFVSEAKEINTVFYPLRVAFDYQKFNGINATTAYSKSEFFPFADYHFIDGRHNNDFTPFVAKVNLNDNEIEDNIVVQGSHLDEEKGELLFIIDGKETKRIGSPQNFTRKVLVGDYDNNGYDDIVLIGTGIDTEPYSGDSTHIIYMTGDQFEIIELDPQKAYFHGGTSGDINNDGLIDILPIINGYQQDSYCFLNNGNKTFEKVLFNSWDTFINYFQYELFDIDNDGYLDLFLGGHEELNEFWEYTDTFTKVILGSKEGFNFDNPIRFPKVEDWGVVSDFDFLDVNNDGSNEIIISRTGSGENFYSGNLFQIIDFNIPNQNFILIETPNNLKQWATNILIQDINKDSYYDIIPFNAFMNNNNWGEPEWFDQGESPPYDFFGLYYANNGSGNFSETYFKKN